MYHHILQLKALRLLKGKMFLKNCSRQEKVLEQCDKNYKFKIMMKLNRTNLTQLFEMISEEEKKEIYSTDLEEAAAPLCLCLRPSHLTHTPWMWGQPGCAPRQRKLSNSSQAFHSPLFRLLVCPFSSRALTPSPHLLLTTKKTVLWLFICFCNVENRILYSVKWGHESRSQTSF